MAKVVVIGAGVGGLATALALGRAGHHVTILERDATPLPTDAHAAFDWDRRGAPQVRHSHAFLARCRNILRDRYPDVLAALIDAGATEMRFAEMPPPEITDREPREGDEDLVALACRRTTFEWILRRSVLAVDHVELLDGVAVKELRGHAASGDSPAVVTGVVADRDGALLELDADLVVAANGRRSSIPAWLAPLGIEVDEDEEDTGIIYYSRFYRLRDDAETPEQNGPIGGDLGYLKYAVFQGDNRTFSVTFAVGTHDDEMRALLLDPDVFDRAARLLPATAPWAAAEVGEAITGVEVMARLVNRIRRFTHDGMPIGTGFAAVGDAHTCTNPLYGRGCSLAMVQATLLADALAEHPDDPFATIDEYEKASAREVEPWYHASIASDRSNRLLAERERKLKKGEDTAELDSDPSVTMGALLLHGLMPAVRTDPDVFRAFIRAFNLLQAPEQLMSDPVIIGKVMESYQQRFDRPPEPPFGPDRAGMLEALTAAAD